jgi:hypothetical protein
MNLVWKVFELGLHGKSDGKVNRHVTGSNVYIIGGKVDAESSLRQMKIREKIQKNCVRMYRDGLQVNAFIQTIRNFGDDSRDEIDKSEHCEKD